MADNIDVSNLKLKYTPDWDELTDILQRAKGPNRSMGDFARACNVSPATFTRIVQKYYKKALSVELIETIVKNADPEAGINISEALRADGYIDITSVDGVSKKTDVIGKSGKEHRLIEVGEIIRTEISRRGYKCNSYWGEYNREGADASALGFDFMDAHNHLVCLSVDIKGCEPRYRTYCECLVNRHPPRKIDSEELFIRILVNYGVFFLRDAWEPGNLKNTMYTFVFSDMNYFKYFIEKMQAITLKSYMSAILIDPDRGVVVKEVMLPRKGGKKLKSIFDQPYVDQDDWLV